jgi:O-antigen ligase
MVTLAYFSASIVLLISALMLIFIGVRRAVWVQIAFLPIANVYVAGLCLAYSIFVFFVSKAKFNGNFRIGIPKIVIYLWGLWLIGVLIGFLLNDLDVRAVFQMAEFFFYGLVVVFIYNLARDSRQAVGQLYVCLTVSSFFLSLLLLVAGWGAVEWPQSLIGRNEGAFVLVCTGLASSLWLMQRVSGYKKLLLGLNVLTVMSAILFASESRSGLVVGLLSVGVYLALVYQQAFKFLYVMTFLVFSAGLVYWFWEPIYFYLLPEVSHSNSERYALLEGSYWLFEEKPFFGWGWGSVERLMPSVKLTVKDAVHPHSSLARFAVEMGILGVILLFGIFSIFLFGAIEALRAKMFDDFALQISMLLVVFLFSFVEVMFFGASRALVVSILLGLSLALKFQSATRRRKSKEAAHRGYLVAGAAI